MYPLEACGMAVMLLRDFMPKKCGDGIEKMVVLAIHTFIGILLIELNTQPFEYGLYEWLKYLKKRV